jgi:hypothetical protein
MAFPRRPSAVLRYLIPALLLALTFYILTGPTNIFQPDPLLSTTPKSGHGATSHPIDRLIAAADKEFADKLAKATETLPDAAAAYRKRRGRHPPPGFNKWHAFAKEKNAVIVEDFWDQIYHDLEPFWALPPAQIRRDAREFEERIEVRDGKASTGNDWFWTKIWLDMMHTIEHLLPDMDIALNPMDEPRVVVPWEEIDGYMRTAAKTRRMPGVKSVMEEFGKLPPIGQAPPGEEEAVEHIWERESRFTLSLSCGAIC